MIKDSKYNLFLFLIIKYSLIDKINISIFVTGTKIHYKYYFIYEYKKLLTSGILNFILVQIPVKKDIFKITVLFEDDNKQIKEKLEFENIKETFNYFYLDKIIYPDKNENDINISEIIINYFNFFFDEKFAKEERYKNDFIKYISEKEKLEMTEEIYFKYIQYFLEFDIKPKYFEKIIIITGDKKQIKSSDIFSFNKWKKNPKFEEIEIEQLFLYLIKTYTKYNQVFLEEMFHSKNSNYYFNVILDCLYAKKLEINQIIF